MPRNACDALVVGAGVSGLTTAICLAEQGLRVLVQADRMPQQTTSAVAGAIWGPHLVEASPRADRWASRTLAVLRELAADPAAGVRIATGVEADRADVAAGDTGVAAGDTGAAAGDPGAAVGDTGVVTSDTPVAVFAKLAELGECRACDPAELPEGFAYGWRYAAPLAHMPTYLEYLAARLRRAGGRFAEGTVTSLAGAARACGAAAVVNCTGASAHHLVPDPQVTPVRGQVVVAANPGLTEFFIGRASETAELAYVFPHGDTLVLGGTENTGDWASEPDPATAQRILRDCAAVDPRLRDVRVLAHRVGLRPFRPEVRLEIDGSSAQDGPVILHNYGHGGAGITLSWGCAQEAARLLTAELA